LPAGFRRLLWAVALFTCGPASQTFLLLRATDAGMPPAQVALLWAAVAATTMTLGVPLSAWSDRVGRLRPMALGWALYALVFVGFGAVTLVPLFWVLAVGVGLYQALTEGAERALIADQVPADQLGTAYGAYYLIKGLLLLPASALFGVLWQYGAAGLAFGLAAGCALAALALLLLWVRPALTRAQQRAA
jgi:MFS family permease